MVAKRWYVIHAYSGFEGHVKRSLIERIERAGMQDLFGEILVPTEEVVEMRAGQQRRSERQSLLHAQRIGADPASRRLR